MIVDIPGDFAVMMAQSPADHIQRDTSLREQACHGMPHDMGRDLAVEDPQAVFLQIGVLAVIIDGLAIQGTENQITLITKFQGPPFCSCQQLSAQGQ